MHFTLSILKIYSEIFSSFVPSKMDTERMLIFFSGFIELAQELQDNPVISFYILISFLRCVVVNTLHRITKVFQIPVEVLLMLMISAISPMQEACR